MKAKKRLTAEDTGKSGSESVKKLTADSDTAHFNSPDKRLIGDEKLPEPPKTEPETTPAGTNLKERIKNSTLTHGLKKLPPGFDDTDGDWHVIHSENFFERLYLDMQSYQKITSEIIEQNYRILREFWQQKINFMHTGANKIKIIRKYAGPGGSERTITNFLKRLEEAKKRLSAPDGIEAYYFELMEKRQQEIDDKIEPMFDIALKDKVLDPSEEVQIRNFCRNQTNLSEPEIDELIEKKLQETKSRRGEGGSGVSEAERLFFYQIKKKLADKKLQIDEEAELLEDLDVYKISGKRYEELVHQVLREIDESEREKTLAQDKQNFMEFYFNLLQDYGLDADDELPVVAREKLVQRDNSETDFFPLSQSTRKTLIEETIERYKIKLELEKGKFYQEAILKLDRYDGHVEAKKQMFHNESYQLLLPAMREEIFERVIDELVEKQVNAYYEASQKYFQLKQWALTPDEIEQFVTIPDQLPHTKNLRYDWLDKDLRIAVFSEATKWAKKEYQTEIKLFSEQVKRDLKRFIHGLPPKHQRKLEADTTHYHLHPKERRDIIIKLETTPRKNAEKLFHESLKKALVLHTLIPQIEQDLLRKGHKELLLTNEKNKISFPVQTARQIIKARRKPFTHVLANKIHQLAEFRRMEPELVKKHQLRFSACITENDVHKFIEEFHPKSSEQRRFLLREFEQIAQREKLQIIGNQNIEQFRQEIIDPVMEERSGKFQQKLKVWYNSEFEQNMVKIGAAYGVTESDVSGELETIRHQYAAWTLPHWGRFSLWFAGIFLSLILLRFLAIPAGADTWVFQEPVRWQYVNFWDGLEGKSFISYEGWMPFPDWDYSEVDDWADLFRYIAIVIMFVFYLIWFIVALLVNLIPALKYLFINLFVFFYNVGVFLLYLLANLGIIMTNVLLFIYYAIIFLVTRLDYILYAFPSLEFWIPWTIFSFLAGSSVSFFINTRNLRRSYQKPLLVIGISVFVFTLASAVLSFISLG